jgi:hypothetical protein
MALLFLMVVAVGTGLYYYQVYLPSQEAVKSDQVQPKEED